MGKLLIEFVIPAIVLAYFGFKLTTYWYAKVFPKQIHDAQEIAEQSEKNDAELAKVKLYAVKSE